MQLRRLLTAGVLLSLVVPAFAQDLVTGNDLESVLAAANVHGQAVLENQTGGDPGIVGTIGELNYEIRFRNCTDHKNCEDLQFYLGFFDVNPGLDKINEWNATQRFSRAYLDSEDDACVEMDLDLVQGVSADYLKDQFAIWALVAKQYAEFVGYS